MPAKETFQLDGLTDMGFGDGLCIQTVCDKRVHPSGTSDGQFVVLFRVDIQKILRLQPVILQAFGTCHSRFFINGEQCLDAGMNKRIAVQYRQHIGHTQAVVCTQSSSLGLQPFSIHHHSNAFRCEIERHGSILLVHHVQMPLQRNNRPYFHSRAGLFSDQQVTCCILFYFQFSLLGKGLYIGADRLLFFACSWDLIEVNEKIPIGVGRQFISLQHGLSLRAGNVIDVR